MKKTRMLTLALVFVLALSMLLVGCSKKNDDALIGTWKLDTVVFGESEMKAADFGLEMSMVINKDGTAKLLTTGEEEEAATWKKSDKGLSITDKSGEEAIEFTLENGKLKAVESDGTMIFVKSK